MNTDDMDKIKPDDMVIVDIDKHGNISILPLTKTNLMNIKEQEINAKYEEWLLRQKMEIRRLDALAKQIETDAKISRNTNNVLFVAIVVSCFALIVACFLKTFWL